MSLKIASDPDDITDAWLTEALNLAGVPGTVNSFTSTPVGTGQVGDSIRFTLTGNGVPASVVGKFPSKDPVSKQTGIAQQNYLREVFFYQNIRETVDIQTPVVYFAGADDQTHDFVILMEDLAPGEQGDQMAGCGVDEAALAMEQLGRLQGPRWGDETLIGHALIGDGYTTSDTCALQGLYNMLAPGFLERYADRLTEGERQTVSDVGNAIGTYNNFWEGPNAFIHIDYRLDNMMFGGPYPLAVVDWQSISIGCPLMDASYFMGTSLDPALRAADEKRLLEMYLEVLRSYGAEIDFETCFTAYRNYAPAGLVMAVIASMIVGETERGNDMFMAMAKRSSQMCEDLDTAALWGKVA
jgi:hypothetical protein